VIDGPIFALDLAIRTGFAVGLVGERPHSISVALKRPDEPRAVALGNLVAWLDSAWRKEKPALVVKEAPLSLQAYRNLGNSEDRVKMDYALHGIVEAMCNRFGITCEQWHVASVRKHFIGRSMLGDRAATKAAVVQRARVLGYIPRDCTDDNRADALALWDFAAARHGRRDPKLVLFGEAS
jgi:hypothetical protein